MVTLVGQAPTSRPSVLRFLSFGIAVVIGIGTLTARLFYLQIANESVYTARAQENRTLVVPMQIDPDGIKAEYNDGLLALFIPRAERDKPRNIQIS